MHCMLMDLLHGFEVLSTTEETLFNSRNVSRLVQNNSCFVSFVSLNKKISRATNHSSMLAEVYTEFLNYKL